MKKKILFLAAAALCVSILAAGTVAYFAAEDQVHNVITTNAVDIEIEEWQETDEGLVPYPKDEPTGVTPGTTVSKIVTIKNIEAEAYIRAKFEIVVTGEDGRVMELPPETLAGMVSVTINDDDWLRKVGDEEWWYYADAVLSDASTEAFFTKVIFDGPNMTNEYKNCTFEVIVKAQATQAANNGDSVLEAAGWPTV
jgi:predicted ribosomally synthesized peptide with SipW-like signal peptide